MYSDSQHTSGSLMAVDLLATRRGARSRKGKRMRLAIAGSAKAWKVLFASLLAGFVATNAGAQAPGPEQAVLRAARRPLR